MMVRKIYLALCLILLLGSLGGCASVQGLVREAPGGSPRIDFKPQRMVQEVRVTLMPEGSGFERVYRGQVVLNKLIRMLRTIDCAVPVPDQKPLEEADSYFSFTFLYSDGGSRECRLLSHQYFDNGRDGWVELPREQALALTEFVAHSRGGSGEEAAPDDSGGMKFS